MSKPKNYGIFNFSTIVSVVFCAYFGNNFYQLSHFWRTEECDPAENLVGKRPECIKPVAEDRWQLSIKASHSRSGKQISVMQKRFKHDEPWEEDVTFEVPKQTLNNGSLFLFSKFELFADKTKQPIEHVIPVSLYRLPTRFQNLISENQEKSKLYTTEGTTPVTHLVSNVAFVSPTPLFPMSVRKWPNEVRARITQQAEYMPPMEHDLLMARHEDQRELLESNTTTTIKIKYITRTVGTFRFMFTMMHNLENMKTQFGFQDKDIDELKSLLADTGIKMLALTFFVSSFHLLFDFLAFKADIQHWRNTDNFTGISFSSILWRAFSTCVILAHLYGEDTSYLILIPMAVSAVIEIWKVLKASKYNWKFWQRSSDSETTETDQLDKEGVRYLSYILWPLCIGGAIYSLLYLEHKSWQQWFLSSVVNGVYGFGFVFMLPQLFINYKLKSVAHLPWKAFMFKAFNTFIDDVFAFLIKMPTSHRIACFRDDLVFFCYLYQRYLYPVDYKRANEYGQTGEDTVEEKDGETKKDK